MRTGQKKEHPNKSGQRDRHIVIKFGINCANHKVTSERILIKNAETSSELTCFDFL